MDREIFSNLQTFIQLVNIATTESVGQWDEVALKKALRWGEYAEKLYTKVYQRQEIARKLSRCLQRIQLQLVCPPGREITLEDLKHSRKLLVKNLLDNTSLPSKVYHLLLISLSSQSLDSSLAGVLTLDEFKKFAEEGASQKSIVKVLTKVEASLSETVDDSSHPTADILTDAHLLRTRLLYQALKNDLESHTQSMDSLLHEVAAKQGGLEVIGTMLGLEKPRQPSYTEECLQECEELIFQWLVKNKDDYKNR